ncbi:hypothetical protein, partial [Actinomadura roseirufa]|uniref:hypothetical protein n=1 Tax=Actinomadura roseirufa TaxID=2094049 RepID=UPI001A955C92
RACRSALAVRDLPGDADLAADLAAALDGVPAPPLAPVPADLGAVAAALEGDAPSVLDLHRGDVLDRADSATAPECGTDDARWLPIPPSTPPGATEDASRARARHWLATHGYRPTPRTL